MTLSFESNFKENSFGYFPNDFFKVILLKLLLLWLKFRLGRNGAGIHHKQTSIYFEDSSHWVFWLRLQALMTEDFSSLRWSVKDSIKS